MKNFVKVQWLYKNMKDEHMVIVDCRSSLTDKEEGRKSYLQGHIPGAYFMNADTQLSGIAEKHGGRHPLPDIEEFKETIEMMGVTPDKKVIAYDDNQLFNAARLWWQLKYIGFDNVYILEGGIDHWTEAGYPLSTEIPERKKGSLPLKVREELLIDAKGVLAGLGKEDFVILDARSKERYLGEHEPIDKIAGHIPGAKLFSAHENLKENGEWKEREEQEQRFSPVIHQGDEIVVYCGSGINACLNFLALEELGITPKLYAGSWSDWISYEDHPIAKGDEGM